VYVLRTYVRAWVYKYNIIYMVVAASRYLMAEGYLFFLSDFSAKRHAVGVQTFHEIISPMAGRNSHTQIQSPVTAFITPVYICFIGTSLFRSMELYSNCRTNLFQSICQPRHCDEGLHKIKWHFRTCWKNLNLYGKRIFLRPLGEWNTRVCVYVVRVVHG